MNAKKSTANRLTALVFIIFIFLLSSLLIGCSATNELIGAQSTHIHEFSEWVTITESTCTEQGSRQRTCACGETQNELIALAEHTPYKVDGILPTCTKAGYTEGAVCSVCNAILIETQELKALGHTETEVAGKAPTCLESGYSQSRVCSVCDAVIVASEDIPPSGHTIKTIPSMAATCTEDGCTESEICSVCNEVIKKAETLSKLGHDIVTKNGKNPTCTKDGKTDSSYCARCDAVITEEQVIPATGHTEKTVKGLAPSCSEDGYTESIECSVCNVIIKAPDTIKALGHSPVTVAATQSTCVTMGMSEHSECSRCGTILSDYTTSPLKEHIPVRVSGADATCTLRGYSESTQCSECRTTLIAPTYFPALSHDFSNNVCTRCGGISNPSINISAPYYGLYEADTLKMICEKNTDHRVEPASITKLITAATALKYLPEDTLLTTGDELYLVNLALSRAYLEEGKQLTLKDMLVALLLPSGSDAAYTIAVHVARHVSGDPQMENTAALDYFTELMNDYVREIGTVSSNFMNPVGKPSALHYITINDLALIASHVLKTYPTITEITSSYRRTVTYTDGSKSTWVNSNLLLNKGGDFYHPAVFGLKTGTADNAGHCLCAVFEKGGKTYIAIVMGCKTNVGRYQSAHELISLVK